MYGNILQGLANQLLARVGDASVRVVALALMAGVLVLFLRRRPAAQHATWTLVILAMVVLPVLRPMIPAAHVTWTRPAALDVIRIGAVSELAASPSSMAASPSRSPTRPSAWHPGWRAYAAIVYLAGVLIFTARLMFGLFLSRRLLWGAQSIGPELRRHFDLVANAGANLEIEESDRVRVPVTAGPARMRVILPAEWRGWSTEKVKAVLAHESAHVRRRDPLVALLAAVNKCIFWFHPLAWWLERRVAVLAEHAADDAGIAVSRDAQSYARIVIEVASQMQEHSSRLIWQAAAMNGPLVARRIRRVMDPNTRNYGGKLGAAVRFLLASSIALLFWITMAADFQSLARAQDNQSASADDQTHLDFRDESKSTPDPATAEQASEMELLLAQNPEDEQTRAHLLRYYSKHEMEEKRVPLVLWLIDHHPESSLQGDLTYIFPFPLGHRPGDPEGFADASQRWWTQVSQHPQDAQVLGNAAYALGAGSTRDEIYLLKRAQALDGKSWTKPLAHLYSYVLVFSTEVGPERNVFGNPLRSPELAAQIRSDLQESDDIELIGAVAFEVVEQLVRRARGHDGRSWDFAALRASATDLITRAEMLDPQNQYVLDAMEGSNGRWSDLMEDVSGLGKAPVREPASPATPSALPQ